MSNEIKDMDGSVTPYDPTLMRGACVPHQKAIWQNCENKGWHNPSCDLPTDLLLIHSEVSEACEAARKGWLECSSEHTSVEEEIADVVIRCFHVAEKNGFDIERTLWEKHRKNITRPIRHGGKLF